MRRLSKLNAQLDRLGDMATYAGVIVPEISGWSVGQHIEHACLAVRNVVAALGRSKSGEKRPKLTAVGRIVLVWGRIPRGRGKAPDVALPGAGLAHDEVKALIEKAKRSARQLDALDAGCTFDHHYFGTLDKRWAVRFMEVHTDHHIRIIEDIIKRRSA